MTNNNWSTKFVFRIEVEDEYAPCLMKTDANGDFHDIDVDYIESMVEDYNRINAEEGDDERFEMYDVIIKDNQNDIQYDCRENFETGKFEIKEIDKPIVYYRGKEIEFTSGYSDDIELGDYIREGYIIDEEAGRINLAVGFIDSYSKPAPTPAYIFIQNQWTENGTQIMAETIEL